MAIIDQLEALEILDSRGNPTVAATCVLADGTIATASVPSGASTGTAEARELRDGDASRYRGLGCRQAVAVVNNVLHPSLRGLDLRQDQLDEKMVALDGTPAKERLGANSLLAVSLAFARAVARAKGLPLYRHFADLIGETPRTLPQLTVNLFSGGKHAGAQVSIQDVLVVPVAARTIDESLATISAVYRAAADLIHQRYGMRLLRADEGGLAPPAQSSEAMIGDALDAIRAAGFTPGAEVALAVDVAATQFYRDGRYHLDGSILDGPQMVARLRDWIDRFSLVSVEDGLAEDDWTHWPLLKQAARNKCLVLGDDLLCTNPRRISRAIDSDAANALLLKVNQIGTLTEAAAACQLAKSHGWHVTVSARSGETEDDWLADLAVGWSGDHLKIGSITQSERLAKYNRLLAVEKNEKFPLASLRSR